MWDPNRNDTCMIDNVPPFLQVSGTASGGILTPTTEALRSMSPDPNSANFQELLSALQGLGEVRRGRSENQDGVWVKRKRGWVALHIGAYTNVQNNHPQGGI